MSSLNTTPYRCVPNTPRVLLRDIKVLAEIIPGDIIEMRGDLLQPFCSHAMYRVRVTVNQHLPKDMRRVHGVLIDFKDSPVQSYAIKESRLFRVEREK